MVRWLALLSLLVVLVGCTPKAPFLGTWKSQAGVALSISGDGAIVLGNERGKWASEGQILTMELDGEGGIRRSNWRVSEDGKTLNLIPLDRNGAEMPGQAVTYLRQ